jgi:hypothetical protein
LTFFATVLLVAATRVGGEDPPASEPSPRRERPSAEARPEDRRAALRELRERHERMLGELNELRAAGKETEAAELKEQVVRIEREIARHERASSPASRSPDEARPGRLPLEGPEIERRHQHLREAVEHLHAAGLPDIAQKVAEAGNERLRQSMRAGPGMPAEAMERLHAQIDELREAVRNLQAQVEKLSRDGR